MSISWTATRKRILVQLLLILLILLLAASVLPPKPVKAAGELSLFTRNASIAVPPGESVTYSIDVINNTSSIQTASIYVQGLPSGWNAELTSGAYKLNRLSVKGEGTEYITLKVDVPHEVQKGVYNFAVVAEGITTLPLSIEVSETGTYKTELKANQPNLTGDSKANFNFRLDLTNNTAEDQLYALTADVDRGWNVTFRVSGSNVTSAQVQANSTQTVNVDIKAPETIAAGTYRIPVRAQSGSTMAETTLEVVITGTYGMELTTPRGLLSAQVTAGKSTKVELVINNKGSSKLEDVQMSYDGPPGWEVEFDQQTISSIEPGESATVNATIKASDKAIPGDYVARITARTPEVSSNADFRITVKTSALWGWIGILIILAVIAGIWHLIRKYGRR